MVILYYEQFRENSTPKSNLRWHETNLSRPLRNETKGDPVDVGRDLFDAYRPCYIRAFNDAKDIVDDKGGKVIQGVESTDILHFTV